MLYKCEIVHDDSKRSGNRTQKTVKSVVSECLVSDVKRQRKPTDFMLFIQMSYKHYNGLSRLKSRMKLLSSKHFLAYFVTMPTFSSCDCAPSKCIFIPGWLSSVRVFLSVS